MTMLGSVQGPARSTSPRGDGRRTKEPSSPPGSTVFVVDDDASVRKSLERLLRASGYRVQTYASAAEFLGRPRTTPDGPQCLILDVRMPGVGGLDLQVQMRTSGTTIPIIFATGFGDITSSVMAMKGGAVDFFTKPVDQQELLAAVKRGLALDAEHHRVRSVTETLSARFARLTPRERQVLGLVVTGMLNKQIAGQLGTCERTIKVHRARTMRKMEAGSVAELVRMAEWLGIPSTVPPSVFGASGRRTG